MNESGRVLEGVRIVEIAGIGPGPFCAMHLADLGADVIAVERPDATQRSSVVMNRGKRSVFADLKTAAGRELVLSLVEGADGLIEGMRPGVMERLQLGPADCHARNERLVYGRMTGWGQFGPLAKAAGHDNNYIAVSGALHHHGTPDEPPSAPLTVTGDIGGGALYLAIGMLAGILRARQSGRGTVVDAAIVDGSAHMLQLMLSTRQKGMLSNERGGSMHDSSHFFATYRCADGGFITVGAIEPQFYALLLERLGLRDDPFFADQWDKPRWPDMKRRFAEMFLARTQAHWESLLGGSDACFASVLSPDAASHHPHMQARSVYFERDGLLQARAAPRFDGQAVDPGPVPARGEHTEAVFNSLATGSVWGRRP